MPIPTAPPMAPPANSSISSSLRASTAPQPSAPDPQPPQSNLNLGLDSLPRATCSRSRGSGAGAGGKAVEECTANTWDETDARTGAYDAAADQPVPVPIGAVAASAAASVARTRRGAQHGVGLAATGLAVGEYGGVEAVERVLHHSLAERLCTAAWSACAGRRGPLSRSSRAKRRVCAAGVVSTTVPLSSGMATHVRRRLRAPPRWRLDPHGDEHARLPPLSLLRVAAAAGAGAVPLYQPKASRVAKTRFVIVGLPPTIQ